MRAGRFFLGAAAAALSAACSGSVATQQSTGTTGGGASTGVSTSGSGAATVAATNSATSAGHATSSSTAASSTGAGGGAVCGTIAGTPCPAADYCAYMDKQCGGNDGSGVCQPRPGGCPQIYDPVCGCDHMVYGNACDANAAGVDVSNLGGCTAPQGMFGCGSGFCHLGAEYCEFDGSDVPSIPSTYGCKPLPSGCGASPSCACLSSVQCGTLCMPTSDGGLRITCPGG